MNLKRILIVDDQAENRELIELIIEHEGYESRSAKNGHDALETLVDYIPDLILLDVMMPGMTGYELTQRLKSDEATNKIPIILVTALDDRESRLRGLDAGADDFLTKPIDRMELSIRAKNLLRLKALSDFLEDQNRNLEIRVRDRTKELLETRLDLVRCLGSAIAYRDNDTGDHVLRMSKSCQLIAREAGLGEETAELILHASPMHDIGKVGIPDHILLKPGPLSDTEWEIMKSHTTIGFDILRTENPNSLIEMAKRIALSHHERWDGTGYPRGIKGEEIPIEARIVSVADVFDALTCDRPYKKAWLIEDALDEIKRQSGKHFDPSVVGYFLKAMTKTEKACA